MSPHPYPFILIAFLLAIPSLVSASVPEPSTLPCCSTLDCAKDDPGSLHADGPLTFASKLFDTDDYPPRWRCGTWTLETGWLHIVSDGAIFLAYFSIPCAIVFFMRKRRDFPYIGLLGLFAAFILACGFGHLIEACIFWWPAYRFSGVVKAVTAIVSWITVFVGLRIIPKLLTLPGTAKLNQELSEQRNFLDTIINDCTLPIFWKNKECQIVGCNLAFAKLIGAGSVKEALVKEAESNLGVPAEHVENYQRDDRRVIDSGEPSYDYEEEIAFVTGLRTLRTSKVPRYDSDGVVIGLIGFCQDITEAKRHEAEIREAERLFKYTFDQAAVGIAHCDLEGKWLLANTQMCNITGYTEAELLQTNFQSITHPEDLEEDKEILASFLRGEITEKRLEKRYLRKDGRPIHVRLTVSAVALEGSLERFIVVVEDISEEIATRESIAEWQAEVSKLSLVAANVQHSVAITDSEGRIEWVNDRFTELTGYPFDQVAGRKPGTFLQGRKTKQDTVERIRNAIRAKKPVAAEIINYNASGDSYWIDLRISPVFDGSGQLINFISTQSDITARKRQQQELKNAMRTANAANVAKSQFLANMSHEIRTPLNGILGFTELLLDDDNDATERHDHLRTIRKSGRHLLELINSVLDLSKIEAGRLTIETMECSPHAILSEVVSILRVRAREKKISLDYEWNGPIPQQIQTDPHRFKQLLMNLIGNAIKFTERGCVRVVAELDMESESPLLQLSIRDTGPGIPADRLETIFEPFVQADSSVTRRYGGTGLGLAISRRIAESLGGSLSCESLVGVGSCFTVRIGTGALTGTVLYSSPPEIATSDIIGDEALAVSLEGLNVLVADDGDTNRKLIRLILTRAGAEVETVDDGKKALELASQKEFDAILMDMQMPVMDGYTATSLLRDSRYERPIIALTANAMKGDRDKCLQAGCSGYLTKPIDRGELTRELARCRTVPASDIAGQPEPVSVFTEPMQQRSVSDNLATFPISTNSNQHGDLYRCSLPVDDPEIREIVENFLEKLCDQIELMERAVKEEDFDEVARLAHWLKGAGGTVGYPCFTDPARQLEEHAKHADKDIMPCLTEIRSLAASVLL